MFGSLRDWIRHRPPTAAPPEPSPPLPPGWQIVAHPKPGIIAYEVRGLLPMDYRTPHSGIGIEMVGLNATEFHGFPPETLEIGKVDVRLEFGVGYRLIYRLHYKPGGWQLAGGSIPVFDYHRLPLGSEVPTHASA
jgi:hypothetical protein